MSTRSIRLACLTGVAAIGLSLAGVALPASAADPVGVVTYSGFSTVQSGGTLTIDIDFALADPAVPGTAQFWVRNYLSCADHPNSMIVVPVTASGHYHNVVALPTNNKTFVEIDTTDGVSMVGHEANYTQDYSLPIDMSATIIPDADPVTGNVQVTTGITSWNDNYNIDIDGVVIKPNTWWYSCDTALVPYAGLVEGSTLNVHQQVGSVLLASLTHAAAPAVVTPTGGLVPPTTTGSTIPQKLDTLALTGFDGRPLGIAGGLLTAAGIGFWLWALRQKRAQVSS